MAVAACPPPEACGKDRQRQTHRDRQRQTETDRDRQTETDRQRQTDRDSIWPELPRETSEG